MSHPIFAAARRGLRVVCAAVLVSGVAVPLFASRPYLVDESAVKRLERGAAPGEKIAVRLPVVDGNPTTLELERFEVWRPDAQIIVTEADGKTTHTVPRPQTRFYKGHVAGDPDSAIAISVEPNGHIEGSVFTADRVFDIGRGRRHGENGPRAPRTDDTEIERALPLLVRELDPIEDLVRNPDASRWHCDNEKFALGNIHQSFVSQETKSAIVSNGTPSTGVSYSLNLAIETDGELWAAFGSDAAVTSYLGTLVAQASVIYSRDLKTTLSIGTSHIWANSATDPWTASDTYGMLAQLGTYWHNNYAAVNRSSVVMISGRGYNSGVAWSGSQLCGSDFLCSNNNCGSSVFNGNYGGGYAFCSSIAGSITTTVPDPTLTVNGVQFGMPNNNNYWMLLEVCHELGHNANGPHTHCVSTSGSAYAGTRSYVDLCYGSEGGGCYGGATSVPSEKGTIMSYCHLFFSAGFPQSRYLFTKTGEPSEIVAPYFDTALVNSTSGLNATITIGSNLACSAGQTASVPANGAATFSWQISGGTITSSTTGNSITFTPNAASVTVTVSVSNAKGCAIINSATTSTQCGGSQAAPTNVVATAASSTSVSLTWTAAASATSYTVYRSANNVTYSNVGTPGTNSFTDNTAAANTAYLYKVTATGPGGTSADSNKDLATTTIFTDPTLSAQSSQLKTAHITELRTAVNAVRKLANSGVSNDFSFTDTTLTAQSTQVKRLHVIDLRTALDAARVALGLTALTYTDSTITIQSTQVKALHVSELRNGVK